MEAIMRFLLRITTCLVALPFIGCNMPLSPICWDFCGDNPPVATWPTVYAADMVGFPTAKLDTSAASTSGEARGLLQVGDSVTFYLISSSNFPYDTLRAVNWSADTTTARISLREDGGMTLVATALGPVMVYTGKGIVAWLACELVAGVYSCTAMSQIDVVP